MCLSLCVVGCKCRNSHENKERTTIERKYARLRLGLAGSHLFINIELIGVNNYNDR